MQYQHIGYGIKGFYRLAGYAISNEMDTSISTERLKVLEFLTKQGWLYLACVIDLYSRKVVGWSMSKNTNTALVIAALTMAINNKPKQQVLLHSDQGST
ncbi:MAG: hypothetical protein A6F71_02430 [Cycloclasticus sp. symbiont of Poecilosclerida sp. M]|nr:MAG: hypothetical protein A6F71_02430 [Cycloclasticus sp. symbiont of Poecilosclerida sp. M]